MDVAASADGTQAPSSKVIPLPYDEPQTTPDRAETSDSHRHRGPISSTPHRASRQPLRELSPAVVSSREPPDAAASRGTPGTYIRGLQSVRADIRRLIDDEPPADAIDSIKPSNVTR